MVGFAAETPTAEHALLELGRAKLARKGCDLLVLNEVGTGQVFGQPTSEIMLSRQNRRLRARRGQQGRCSRTGSGTKPSRCVQRK